MMMSDYGSDYGDNKDGDDGDDKPKRCLQVEEAPVLC